MRNAAATCVTRIALGADGHDVGVARATLHQAASAVSASRSAARYRQQPRHILKVAVASLLHFRLTAIITFVRCSVVNAPLHNLHVL